MLPLYDEADAKYALTDAMGRNVIHYAALCNAAHLVNYFAACGANVNLVDENGDAPIHLAAKDANVEALVALLRNNCDVDVKDAFAKSAAATNTLLYLWILQLCSQILEVILATAQKAILVISAI
ncbi:hypothetical protein V3C99_012550 [Haemonchus contortus]